MPLLSSGPSSTVQGTVTRLNWELQNPYNGSMNIVFNVIGTSFRTRRLVPASTFHPIGRNRSVQVVDTIKGEEITLQAEFIGIGPYNQFVALLESQVTLLLQSTYGDQWYVQFEGDVSVEVINTVTQLRLVDITFIEVDQPQP